MNRNLKFRAWDTKNKTWIESVPPREYMIDSDEWDRRDCDDGSGESCLFFPNNPMGPTFNGRIVYQQYLTINDKSGKEMCEGDILKWGMGPMYEIVWDMTYAKFHFPTITNQEGVYYLPEGEIRNSTICGNIFETPHLKEMNF